MTIYDLDKMDASRSIYELPGLSLWGLLIMALL